ncbi:cryptochrome/photolyase family protein [Tenacibaculum sp. SZ-18]|uniref:cryptochrome/photolyase family protein n=1 Tax=Tenacibaculum sp. SZ-18 TaxID=754423 RepID=UPI000C2D1CA4|nr:cryptochrome/photolyase family protein [Tenacibaculum sp. SZ-18]AUC14973.1 cryptochrome/photolyase family protein [Tenacibaculum sp. SZ-18]
MNKSIIIFPHQLVQNLKDFVSSDTTVFLVEETLFFNQYNFHKQKLVFHRSSMKFYEDYLSNIGFKVNYIDAKNELSDTRNLLSYILRKGIEEVTIFDPTDNWLEKRISEVKENLRINWLENPLFLNTKDDLSSFFKETKKKFFQTSFYKEQRLKRNVLVTNGEPVGGKWTYDVDNRKKYPKNKITPVVIFPDTNEFFKKAVSYVNSEFKDNVGELHDFQIYPSTYKEAEDWLRDFYEVRFHEFGDYEDAILQDRNFLHHSILSPLINVGLLSPKYVIESSIDYATKNDIPINSLEGFVRQILGWREFIRGVYMVKGSEERTKNFWKHSRKIPDSFYDGTTGILPIDKTIKRVIKTSYTHHIERLMILGNFMLLCEFDPDEVYRWFMELFIDAYDWVMVPNVYGMSLFADGGLMSTKPYISSSNYVKKMSDYPNGDWQLIWDGLFWRFMDKNREFLSKNPRLRMLISNLDKMSDEKRTTLFEKAEGFLETLENNHDEREVNFSLKFNEE